MYRKLKPDFVTFLESAPNTNLLHGMKRRPVKLYERLFVRS
jgi:hypothetical protein